MRTHWISAQENQHIEMTNAVHSARRKIDDLPYGRARSIGLTKLDEAEMWATKAIEEPYAETEE